MTPPVCSWFKRCKCHLRDKEVWWNKRMIEAIPVQSWDVYWFSWHFFGKAKSTLTLQEQTLSAEVKGTKLSVSLALELVVRAVWAKAGTFLVWDNVHLSDLRERSILSRNNTFRKCLRSLTSLTYSSIFSCIMNFVNLPFFLVVAGFSPFVWFVLSLLSSFILIWCGWVPPASLLSSKVYTLHPLHFFL